MSATAVVLLDNARPISVGLKVGVRIKIGARGEERGKSLFRNRGCEGLVDPEEVGGASLYLEIGGARRREGNFG